jgi:prepilin-type N-terminal cleavage/methylation domain-containing protein
MPRTKNKKTVSHLQTGFTFIEIMIVIAMIGLLSIFFINTQTNSAKKARDTQRKSDLRQYQNALEVYSSKNSGLYPSRSTTARTSTTLCGDLGNSSCSEDPKYNSDNTFVYSYQTDGTGNGTLTATKYVLWAKLEFSSDYWVYCSNGLSGTKPQSGFSVSSGTCPLP